MMKAVVLLVLVLAFVLCNTRRNDALFSEFPLDEQVSKFYNTLTSDLAPNSLQDLSTLVQSVVQKDEQDKIEQITRALDSKIPEEVEKKTASFIPTRSIFHNYDSSALVLFGKADLKLLRYLLRDEQYQPIVLQGTEQGLVALWIVDNKDTSLGASKQLIMTCIAYNKNLGRTLGVTYDPTNDASLLFPAFGKLPDHARYFVMYSMTDREAMNQFSTTVHKMPSQVGAATFETLLLNDKSHLSFRFADNSGNLIFSGKVEEDNSWSSYFTLAYKIFNALGLSGILDLYHSKFVSAKFAGPVSTNGKWNTMQMNMKQQFQELKNVEFNLGSNNAVAHTLRELKFAPTMAVRMPVFQYAMMAPREQAEDNEFTVMDDVRILGQENDD